MSCVVWGANITVDGRIAVIEGCICAWCRGKTRLQEKYYKMIDTIKLPVFILLDSDALETRELILTKLRVQDKIHLIKSRGI